MAASTFSSAGDICEGDDCEATTDVTYRVEVNKKLCSNCASKERCIRKARKGGPKLYCEKHDKDLDLYCKTHGVYCCYSCALIDHQKPCVQQAIEETIIEKRASLTGLTKKAMDKLRLCRLKGDRIRECREDADKHLHAMNSDVDSVIEKAIKMVQDREREDAAKIDLEIDEKNDKLQEEIRKINEKIQKNNEERKKRHELNHSNAEKKRQPMDNKQRSLHADIQNIAEETERKIGELEKSWQDDTKTVEKTIQTLDTVLEDDQNVVKDGHRVITSVADELHKPLDEGGVEHITRTVSGVRFVKGAGREKYNGRIDGYDGEWRLIDTINVKNKIINPIIVGCIDECNVIITDRIQGNPHTYMLDMNTKHAQRVITSSDTSWVVSCALLNDDEVVCGKRRKGCTGDSLTGCITMYNREWKPMNDVTIPRNTADDDTITMNVAVDQDGMIIAAEWYQSKIYVINPADGKIMNTITCKQNIVMRGVLSSGHIIAQWCSDNEDSAVAIFGEGAQWCSDNEDSVVAIIDREGTQREITHSDEIWNVCIDPMTDDLYVVTSGDRYKTCVIDQVMSGDDMKKRRVASFPLSTTLTGRGDHLADSLVLMTSSEKMIACDGENILIFKNKFNL